LLIVTLSQIGAPAASTRFTSSVFGPTPWTVATMIEPPADPELGEISVSFGVRVKPASRMDDPRPFPFSKYTLKPVEDKSSASVIVKYASVGLIENVVYSLPLISSVESIAAPVNPVPVTLALHVNDDESNSGAIAVIVGRVSVKVNLQIGETQVASSDVFKKTIAFQI
jgi:hypothetical protein